jgi:single-strand DNA-binding protein
MVNKVTIIGNLGANPELKELQSGQKVCTFSVATSESYKDDSGQWQDRTEWHRVVSWGPAADKAARLDKGQTIYLEGKIQTRKWQDNKGNDRYSTEIVAGYFRKIGGVKPEQISEMKSDEGIPF